MNVSPEHGPPGGGSRLPLGLEIGVSSGMMAVAIITVALRFISRRLAKAKLLLDDWTALIALLLVVTHVAVEIISIRFAAENPMVMMKDPSSLVKLIMVDETVYNFAQPAIKFSILLFYHRLFPDSTFRKWLWGTAIFIVMYSIVQALTFILQCMPVALFWDKSLDGHCIDESKVLIVVSSMNVFTNFMLLVMPITQLWNLKVGQSKKIQLMAVFLLGGGECIISIVRAVALTGGFQTGPIVQNSSAALWSSIELCTGMVCACLPAMRPLVLFLRGRSPTTSRDNNSYPTPSNFHDRSVGSPRKTQQSTFSRSEVKTRSRDHDSGYENLEDTIGLTNIEAQTTWKDSVQRNSNLECSYR